MVTPAVRFGLLAVLLLALAGCSSTAFIYNRLGFLITWNVDDYVDLSGAQKKELRHLLEPFLEWHRAVELPQYLDALDDAEALLEQPLIAENLQALASEFEQAWYRTESESLEWIISFGEHLSSAQISEFLKSLKTRQIDFEEKYLSRSETQFRKDAFENMLDPAQDYLGRLSREQRALLEEASDELQRSDSIWLKERAAWQIRLEKLLQRQSGWQQDLRDAIAQRRQTTSRNYIDVYEHNAQVIYAAVAELLNSRTHKQNRKLRRKLASFRDDILILIAQGQDRAA